MNKDFQEKWVAALRSGEYKQGDGVLRRAGEVRNDDVDHFCCLGVACDIIIRERLVPGVEWKRGIGSHMVFVEEDPSQSKSAVLPPIIAEYMDIGTAGDVIFDGEFNTLVNMNDSGDSFDQIASVIENARLRRFGETLDILASDEGVELEGVNS